MEDESLYVDIYGKSPRQDEECRQASPSTLLALHALLNESSRFAFNHEDTSKERTIQIDNAFDSGIGIIVGVLLGIASDSYWLKSVPVLG
jgi:hypothetical protein